VNAIRAIEERFPKARKPRPEYVAIVHDADSIAASWLKDALLDGITWPRRLAGYQEENGTREGEVRAWLRQLERSGFTPGAVSLGDLGPEMSDRFPVLILPRILVVSETDLGRLQEHLDRGGALVITSEFAWVDRRGAPWDNDPLLKLKASKTGFVKTSSSWLSGPERKELPGISETFIPPGFLDLPSSSSVRTLPDGRLLVALLPNEKERLRTCGAVVPTDEAFAAELLHPAGQKRQSDAGMWMFDLPAGEAAVFLLTPKD
jgi:hypothetical protein